MADIDRESDFLAIEDLEIEHTKYSLRSPIFLKKNDSRDTARAGLQERQKDGDALFVYRENGIPTAYFLAGDVTKDEGESANIYGGNFWRRHFTPYLYFSMRYVESCH